MANVRNLSTDQFVTKGNVYCSNGKVVLGTDLDSNTFVNGVNLSTGSAFTQGQLVRSYYELNDNSPFLYTATNLDTSNILSVYSDVFSLYPNLTDYVYLTNIWWENQIQTTIENSLENPVYIYNGKGLGKIEFYNNFDATEGEGEGEGGAVPERGYPNATSFYYSPRFHQQIYVEKPRTIPSGFVFPYCGLLYSGLLVQLHVNSVANNKLQVVPYQTGRGIPQYNPNKEYFSGDAYGIPYWPNTTIPIEPQLASGIFPGNNNYCAGVVLDSAVSNFAQRVYPTNRPTPSEDPAGIEFGFPSSITHPAPFTTGPRNISFYSNSTREFSPENSAGNYWAPWPDYYAYQPNEPVPVLHDGLVTCLIGAATNIGMQCYYEPDISPGDNPIGNPAYLSIPCIPLFQGEEISIGSYVYASAMGHVITGGSPIGKSPYLPASYLDAAGNDATLFDILVGVPFQGVQRKGYRENPWYDYHDPTFGAMGWTSTPQFALQSIPDLGRAIIESRDPDTPLDYLNQSNQGSLIVQARTVEEGGSSGRMTLIGPSSYSIDNRMSKFPGTVERSQCVGSMMQTIQGTGTWTYTGQILDFQQTPFEGGIGYTAATLYNTIGGTGTGATVLVTAVNAVGTITGVTLNSSGSGYTNGDILTIVDSAARNDLFGTNAFNFYANCATVTLNTQLNTITLSSQGSNYTSSLEVEGYNLSANNLIVSATASGYAFNESALYTILTPVPTEETLTDPTRYPTGTQFRVFTANAAEGDLAVCEVATNDGTNITLAFPTTQIITTYIKSGSNNIYDRGTFLYNTQRVTQTSLRLTILADNLGQITQIQITDMGENNRNGDIILIRQNSNNCCFVLNNDPGNILTFSAGRVKGGYGYYFNSAFFSDALDTLSVVTPPYLETNSVDVYTGLIPAGATGRVGDILQPSGTITNFFFDPPTAIVTNGYSAEVYDIQTIVQVYPFNLATQPIAGAQPATGWPSFVYRNTATFTQPNINVYVLVRGTGYTIGGPYTTTGGTGTGLTVYVTELADSVIGSVRSIRIANSGINLGYLFGDTITISGNGNGDCEIVLKVPETQEITFRYYEYSSIPGQYYYTPVLLWRLEIIEPGTNYLPGLGITTTCPVYITAGAINLTVNILSVDGITGGITDIEVATYDNVNLYGYQIDYSIIIDGGNSDCVVRLQRPQKAEIVEFTNGGTGYSVATGVSTFNMSANNLATICGLDIGGLTECDIIDYGIADLKPSFWDLSRYQVGDILEFNQDGNVSATAEIILLDEATQEIQFNQLTAGVNYVQPATSMYGFLPTNNLSNTVTTVDIISVDPISGAITEFAINTLGTNLRYGDYLTILQGDQNCVIRIASAKDIPAPSQPFVNGRPATAEEWNEYKSVLTSAVNLHTKPCMIDFKKHTPNEYNNSYYYYGDPDNKDPYRGLSTITF